jgi:hypothetical protein
MRARFRTFAVHNKSTTAEIRVISAKESNLDAKWLNMRKKAFHKV